MSDRVTPCNGRSSPYFSLHFTNEESKGQGGGTACLRLHSGLGAAVDFRAPASSWALPCEHRAPGWRGAVVPGTDLLCLLVEDGRHVQQSAALVQGGRERLPLLLQLAGNLLDLLGGVVARLHQAAGHRHDAVYVHVYVLRRGQKAGLVRGRRTGCLSKKCGERSLKSYILTADSAGG